MAFSLFEMVGLMNNDAMWFVIAMFIWLGFMAIIAIWG